MKGVYILIVELQAPAEIRTLRRTFILGSGFYAYVGSAMSNLEARINRHLSYDKKRHWHIDFLLDTSRIRAVVSAQIDEQVECHIAGQLSQLRLVPGFGCSHCHCRSHLFYSPKLGTLVTNSVTSFERLGLEPIILLI